MLATHNRIPGWLKVAYTAFMAVLVPVYWINYGPTNFLYFCDIALFFTLVAIWTESRILTSIPTVGILLPQLLWCLDFACGLFGYSPLGMTAYMFESERDLFLRSLSLFHGWLPFLLLYMIGKIGYDKAAFRYWWSIAWIAMFIAFFYMPKAKDANDVNLPYNINYVYGLTEAQTWMPEWPWFCMALLVIPIGFSYPTHLVLRRQ
jgi:hypothetical protein